jgi:hypothetical protein
VLSWFLPFSEWSENEVMRILSPDGRLEAVLTQSNAGATTSFKYRIYITIPGTDFRGQESLFVGDKLRNKSNHDLPLIHWNESHELLISYDSAQVYQFKNFWRSRQVDNGMFVVRVSLIETGGLIKLQEGRS